jgi:hypothetical protein
MHHQSAPWKVWCIFVGQEVNNDEDISDPHTTKSLKRIMRAFGHRPRVSRELLILGAQISVHFILLTIHVDTVVRSMLFIITDTNNLNQHVESVGS